MAEYTPKAVTSTIRATSRMSLKVKDNFYTVEYTEERVIPDVEGVDIEQERVALWDAVNAEVDNQAQEIYNSIRR